MVATRAGWRQYWLPLLATSVALPFVATAVTDRYALPLRWLLMVYLGALLWMLSRVTAATTRWRRERHATGQRAAIEK